MDNNGHRGVTHGPRTVCKICGCSVFETDRVCWTRRGVTPGIAHEPCVEQVAAEQSRAGTEGGAA